jgi:hypothetical protein
MGPEVKQGRFRLTSVEFKCHFYGIFSRRILYMSELTIHADNGI